MRILILGSGGRECAFAWKLSAELPRDQIFIAPGNAGTNLYGTNVALSLTDFSSVGSFCIAQNIAYLLPGGEDTLVAGIRDYFENTPELRHIYVFGPDAQGARMEGSKEFAKKFMEKYGIPTARYQSFIKGEENEAKAFLRRMTPPYVIKADGLAAGKGVVIPETLAEADLWVEEMLCNDQFGKSGNTIVIEEFLKGIEVSYFAVTDGKSWFLLPEAKDYKRVGEGDKGPNTGGMGAVSPVSFLNEAFHKKVKERIVQPTFSGLKNEGIDYRGFLFFGLINVGGDPYVIEYNCRMGDPETEVVLPRLKTPLLEIIERAAMGKLTEVVPEIDPRYFCTVMLVSEGYPGTYPKGREIRLAPAGKSLVFHAGTQTSDDKLLTSGGRVLAITSNGQSMEEALDKSYRTIEEIYFEGMNYRKDIGQDLLGTQYAS